MAQGLTNTKGVSATQYALELDDAGSGITYVGESTPGSVTSAAVWRIKRLDESVAPDLIILWADGNASFDNVWDDRASLSYS
jgi:hypothetical protein